MACITFGTSKIESESSFRIPFGIFFIIPCVVSIGAWFMKEASFLRLPSTLLTLPAIYPQSGMKL